MALWTPTYPIGLPVGDDWVETASFDRVRFPYDDSVVASAPVGDADLARQAVDAAVGVRRAMRDLPSHARAAALHEVHATLAAQREDVERLLVLETGKPLVDCKVEVARSLLALATSAEEVARLHGETVPLDLLPAGEGLVGFWRREPIGVVVGITGFNYPLLLASHKVGPALAAGCPVIVKPPPQAPLATLWLVHLLRRALAAVGGPVAGVQLVTGGPDVGAALTTDPRVACVSFTGSAAVGHRIARDAAPRKVVLELGANSALVVAPDADLDAAADAVVRGGFYANGQACISVQRVVVVDAVREAFLERLSGRLDAVVVGDPREADTRVAALIDHGATQRVRAWVDAAVDAGATLVRGGGTVGTAVEPTLLVDVPDGVDAWDEEVFGPVVCVRSVPDLATAYDVVNRSRYGLHCAMFTSSLDTAFAAAREIEAGGVVVNEVPGFRSDVAPYGGVKDSGIGRESALALAAQGARVTVADRDRAAAEATCGLGEGLTAYELDVLDDAAITRAAEELDPVDALVFTAATNVRKRVLDYSSEEFDRVVSLNLRASFTLIRAFGAGMAERGRGTVVGFSSIRGVAVEPGQSVYAATKAGLVQLLRTAAAELGPRGVRFNAVAPGVVETPLTRQIQDDPEWYGAYAAKAALGRWAQPQEMAGAVVYLCSDASSFVTGSVVYVDGGWTAVDGRFEPPN